MVLECDGPSRAKECAKLDLMYECGLPKSTKHCVRAVRLGSIGLAISTGTTINLVGSELSGVGPNVANVFFGSTSAELRFD